jgi:hypothetical protein
MIKIDFKKIFTRGVDVKGGGKEETWPVNFARDWKIVVLVFAVGIISLSLFAWRIYLSNQIAGGYLAPEISPTSVSIKTVDEKRLQTDLLILETKQADFIKAKSGFVKMVDPSL